MADQVPVINTADFITIQINNERGVTYNENGDRLFYMDNAFFTLHNRRVLYDDTQNPIFTFYSKAVTMHERCKVFNGESTDSSQLLFSVKKTNKSIPPGITKLNVFLANNRDRMECDFRVIIYGNRMSCTVYAGESPTIVAQVQNNGGFNVKIKPSVNCAFIVALLMIVKDMNCSNQLMDNRRRTNNAVELISSSIELATQ